MANSAFEIAVEAYIAEHGSIDINTVDALRTVYETGISKKTQAAVAFKRGYNHDAEANATAYIKSNQNHINRVNSTLTTLIKKLENLKIKGSGRDVWENRIDVRTGEVQEKVKKAVDEFNNAIEGLSRAFNSGRQAANDLKNT